MQKQTILEKIFTHEHKDKYTRLFMGTFFSTSEKLETPKWARLNKAYDTEDYVLTKRIYGAFMERYPRHVVP